MATVVFPVTVMTEFCGDHDVYQVYRVAGTYTIGVFQNEVLLA